MSTGYVRRPVLTSSAPCKHVFALEAFASCTTGALSMQGQRMQGAKHAGGIACEGHSMRGKEEGKGGLERFKSLELPEM